MTTANGMMAFSNNIKDFLELLDSDSLLKSKAEYMEMRQKDFKNHIAAFRAELEKASNGEELSSLAVNVREMLDTACRLRKNLSDAEEDALKRMEDVMEKIDRLVISEKELREQVQVDMAEDVFWDDYEFPASL